MMPDDGDPDSPVSPEDAPARPEAQLLAALREIAGQMESAVGFARAIGPEWENVVIDIQLPLLDQLSQLAQRLSHRLSEER